MSQEPAYYAQLRTQAEFYFGDVNLVKDNFLKEQIADDEEGFVPLKTMLLFKRLATILKQEGDIDAEAEQDKAIQALAAAFDKSEQLQLSESKQAVKRRAALPESVTVDNETAYIKHVPAGAKLEEMQNFFGKFGKVRAIWRRYFNDATNGKSPKESVFVVFDSSKAIEDLKAAKTSYPETNTPLLVLKKTEYLTQKNQEHNSNKQQNQNQNSATAAASGGAGGGGAAEKRPAFEPLPKNSSITLTGCGELEGFKSVKSLWEQSEASGIRFTLISQDKTTATVIFKDTDTRSRMIESLKNRAPKLNDKLPEVAEVPEGEADDTVVAKATEELTQHTSGGRGGGGGRGRGGRGGNRGRGGRGGNRGRGGGGSRRQRD